MKISKENFIEDFIQTAIAQGETVDETGLNMNLSEYKALQKNNNRLSKKLDKLSDFLVNDTSFAKEVIDKLVLNSNFYVMFATTALLWQFNYRMKDCYRLFEKIIIEKDKKYGLSVIAAENFYLAIKEGRLKRRREFPKLD